MSKPTAQHLKLHLEDVGAVVTQPADFFEPLRRTFSRVTGWSLRFVPDAEANESFASHKVARGPTSGAFVAEPADFVDLSSFPEKPARAECVQPFVQEINCLLAELNRAHDALWRREAELAAGVPVVSRADEHLHLAERLAAVVQSGAEAVGCQAAAAYLLDDATSELKLRVGWGLPRDRWLAPARPLRGALADLEALLGHAVVLQDTALLPHWKCPEDFPAAVCVPIATSSMPLGTLWIFCDEHREFTPVQTNLLEIVAGRLAAELEREMLLADRVRHKQIDRDTSRMLRWQRSRLPQIEPLVDGWEVAGWTTQAAKVGGQLLDWSVLPSGNLTSAVGHAAGSSCEATLTAATLHGALKALAGTTPNVRSLFTRLNDTFWIASAGDQHAGLAYAEIEPESGAFEFLATGPTHGLILSGDEIHPLPASGPMFGVEPDLSISTTRRTLHDGDLLLLYSIENSTVDGDKALHDARRIGEILRTNRHRSPRECVAALRSDLGFGGEWFSSDASLLIVKRRKTSSTRKAPRRLA